MRSFEIEVILVKHFLKLELYFGHTLNDVLNLSVRFIKLSRFCTLQIKCSLHRHLALKCLAAMNV